MSCPRMLVRVGAQSVPVPGSTYTSRVSPRTCAQLFRIVATAEAVSWAGLLSGMYFKYLTDAGDLGVRIFGPIHGGIFGLS